MRSISKMRRKARAKRKVRVRKKVHGTADRPRLTVFRSHRYIYAQVVDDEAGHTLLDSSSLKPLEVKVPDGVAGKCAVAYSVGMALAEKAKGQGLSSVVFDRSGYLYHGRVAALARGARDGGLKF